MEDERRRDRRQPVQRGLRVPVLIDPKPSARTKGGPASRGLAFGIGALVLAAATGLVGGAAPGPAEARVLVDRDRALAAAFPGATLRTRTVFLDSLAVHRAEQAAGARLASPRVTRYEASRGDSLLGTAYLDTHRVRTMNETVMIVVSPAGRVRSVETLAFAEPDDYLAPRRWLATFEDRALAKDLRPGGAVPNLGGSTLTARAIAAAVRRTLALHGAIAEADRAAAGKRR